MDIMIYEMELDAQRHPVLVMEKKAEYDCSIYNTANNVVNLLNSVVRMNCMAEEQVWMLALDTASHLTGIFRISHGIVNSSLCNPREIYLRALAVGAVSIIIVHNHPSGDCHPSDADQHCSKRISKAGKLLGVKMIDFIIIGNGYYSFSENGDLK